MVLSHRVRLIDAANLALVPLCCAERIMQRILTCNQIPERWRLYLLIDFGGRSNHSSSCYGSLPSTTIRSSSGSNAPNIIPHTSQVRRDASFHMFDGTHCSSDVHSAYPYRTLPPVTSRRTKTAIWYLIVRIIPPPNYSLLGHRAPRPGSHA